MISGKCSIRKFLKSMYDEAAFLDTESEIDYGVAYTEYEAKVEKFARPIWEICWDSNASDFLVEEIRVRIADYCCPTSVRYWGKMDDYSQIAVEILPIALFLYNKREQTWDKYTEEEQDYIAKWFLQINEINLPDNNWLFFRVLTNLIFFFFKKVESPRISCVREFEKIEQMYVGNGWYSDGLTRQRDYYVAFAIHYYSLIYARLAKCEDMQRSKKFIERAKLFANEYIYWFSEDGSTVPFGRSLIYRFAANAFWGASVWVGVDTELSVSEIKGIIFRNFRWWEEKQISRNGKLSLGYVYPNSFMTEEYNSQFSPLWCLKSAIILDLPEDHLFWHESEANLPELDPIRLQSEAGIFVSRNKESVMLFSIDQRSEYDILNSAAKYEKFVYSNISGFSVQRDINKLANTGGDSSLTISLDNHVFINRGRAELIACNEEYILTRWEPFGKTKQMQIYSYIIPGNPFHVRIHQVKSSELLYVYDNGFSVDRTDIVQTRKNPPGNEVVLGSIYDSVARAVRLGDECLDVQAAPNCNILFPNSSFPSVKNIVYPGCTTIINVFGLTKQTEEENKYPDVRYCKRKEALVIIGNKKIKVPLQYYVDKRIENMNVFKGKIKRKMQNMLMK